MDVWFEEYIKFLEYKTRTINRIIPQNKSTFTSLLNCKRDNK